MTKDEIILAQQARIEQLLSVVEDLSGLIDESSGVYGLHLNGDTSPWEELLPGGRFERITNFYEALPTPDDLSALRAMKAAIWREAAQLCRNVYAFTPEENDSYRCMKECEARAEAIEKGGES